MFSKDPSEERRRWPSTETYASGDTGPELSHGYALKAAEIPLPKSFRSLASKGFPSGYSKRVCVSACTQKAPNLQCFKRRLTNTPRHHHLADVQLSSLYPPSQSCRKLEVRFMTIKMLFASSTRLVSFLSQAGTLRRDI